MINARPLRFIKSIHLLGLFSFAFWQTLSNMPYEFSNSNFHSAIKLWVVKHPGNSICMHSVYHLRNGKPVALSECLQDSW